MSFSVYINYKGKCREAMNFYSQVFGGDAPRITTFGDMPASPDFPLDDATKPLVAHAEFRVGDATIMGSDVPDGMPYTKGNNITIMVQSKSKEDLARWYEAIKSGGDVEMALGPQSWSPLYAFVHDRYGIGWHFNLLE
ncbi:MAG TPA: VOC family protein [Rectinemataceae bacterium]|nr:VOC family protein [Rectinemataceae bacterium]